jgi:hypothetical protein
MLWRKKLEVNVFEERESIKTENYSPGRAGTDWNEHYSL